MPVIGFLVNAVDLGLNIYELSENNDPYQRPAIITNTVLSAVGLTISTAAIIAATLGASAVAGPLGLVELGIAVVYIPISYFVGKFTERIEGAKHTGLVLKYIREEIEAGTYKRIQRTSYYMLHRMLLFATEKSIIYQHQLHTIGSVITTSQKRTMSIQIFQ